MTGDDDLHGFDDDRADLDGDPWSDGRAGGGDTAGRAGRAGNPGRTAALLVAAGTVLTVAGLLARRRWLELKATPAFTEDAQRAGLHSLIVQVGPYRMFARVTRAPASSPLQPAPLQPAPLQPAPLQPTSQQPAPLQPAPLQPTSQQPAPQEPTAQQPALQPTPQQPAHPQPPAPPQPTLPPLVLVHGLAASSRSMEPLATVLATDFDVYAPDLPGFGESPFDGPPLDVPALADALHAWLQAVGLERAAFVGQSFGCQVLAEFAVRFPQAVTALVLQGPTVDPHARSLPRLVVRDLLNAQREHGRSPRHLSHIDAAKAGLWRLFATLRNATRHRIENRLPLIRAKTLVVGGSRDPVSPPGWTAQVAYRLPQGELLMLRGGTHSLNYAYPHSFAHAIRPFLADAIAATPSPSPETPS